MNGHMDTDANGVRMPRIEMRKLEDDYAEFVLENTDASMANALRRIMIAEVRIFRHSILWEQLISRWPCEA